MNHSDSLAAIGKALAVAQGEVENAGKTATNPHYKSKYADLAEIINTVRPVFSKHGLAVVQHPAYSDGIVSVETMILHESGEWISSTVSAPVSKQDAQGVGSAITYCRRYALAAVAGIAQEDDDGEGAVGRGKKEEAKPDRPEVKIDSRFVDLINAAETLDQLQEVWKAIPNNVRHDYEDFKNEAKRRLA